MPDNGILAANPAVRLDTTAQPPKISAALAADLERFSDAAGEAFARGEVGRYPATARQVERFNEALRKEAANRYALAAALWELWPSELTQTLRLAALRDVLRARVRGARG